MMIIAHLIEEQVGVLRDNFLRLEFENATVVELIPATRAAVVAGGWRGRVSISINMFLEKGPTGGTFITVRKVTFF